MDLSPVFGFDSRSRIVYYVVFLPKISLICHVPVDGGMQSLPVFLTAKISGDQGLYSCCQAVVLSCLNVSC